MHNQLTSYDIKSRKKDFAQHAKKIYTAIRELDPRLAVKRAVWELFQNALDLSKQSDTIIKIQKANGGLRFEHNGKPFDEDSLSSLIKQTSDKTFGDNSENTGQYGTGFLTTHIYGKNFSIFGSVLTEDNGIKELNNFKIERQSDNIDDLIMKIEDQDRNAREICSGSKYSLIEHSKTTSFLYETSEDFQENVDQMIYYLPDVLPYVFAFNEKLQIVEIIKEDRTTIFERSVESTVGKLVLTVNKIPKQLDFILSEDKDIKIILPETINNLSEFPKLFLYYPLIGTENIGYNFVIHSKHFRPNEKRNSIFLEAKNTELIADVEINKDILKSSFNLVKQYVSCNSSVSILPFLNIHFTGETYLDELKTELVDYCKELERIILNNGGKSNLSSICFFDRKLLEYKQDELRSVYDVTAQFYNLPSFDVYIYLCTLVDEWEDFGFIKIGLEDILETIETKTALNYDRIQNIDTYLWFIKLISDKVELLTKYKVIPNIHHRFMSYSDLRRWDVLEPELILVMDNINGAVSETYLLDTFYFIEHIQAYTREHYKGHINDICTDLFSSIDRADNYSIPSIRYYYLTKWINYFVGLYKDNRTNTSINSFLSAYYEFDCVQGIINDAKSVLQYDSPIKLIARLYIVDLKKKDKASLQFYEKELEKFVSILYGNSELRKNLLDKLECFLSQSYQLCSANDLKIDKILNSEFKKEYNEITKSNILNKLVVPIFAKFLQHEDVILAQTLGTEIELILLRGQQFYKNVLAIDTGDTDFLTLLLKLIGYISVEGSLWGDWLPKLNQEKEEILLSRFDDISTRNSLFAILSKTPDTIKLLGRLSEVNDLEGLIKKGEEKLKEEARQKRHKEYIRKIGLRVQDVIENELDKQLAKTIELLPSEKIEAKEEQNGQDFVIRKNSKNVYYIEVKSKWDPNGRFLLSKNQTEKCAQEKSSYAVVSVNIDRYRRESGNDAEDIDFDEVKAYVKVNCELGVVFEKLVSQNIILNENLSPKLVDYSGLVPQKVVDTDGVDFDTFIKNLKFFLNGI